MINRERRACGTRRLLLLLKETFAVDSRSTGEVCSVDGDRRSAGDRPGRWCDRIDLRLLRERTSGYEGEREDHVAHHTNNAWTRRSKSFSDVKFPLSIEARSLVPLRLTVPLSRSSARRIRRTTRVILSSCARGTVWPRARGFGRASGFSARRALRGAGCGSSPR